MEEDKTTILMAQNKSRSSDNSVYKNTIIELRSFKSGLPTWLFLDQSSIWTATRSWSIFIILTICIPLVSLSILSCSNCDVMHQRPYDLIVQLSFSFVATLSFINLSMFTTKYGLLKFLFLDKLLVESKIVQDGYAQKIRRSMKLLSIFVLPCFVMDCAYKIWWFSSNGHKIPFFYNIYLSNIIICLLMICSWLYRTSIFFFVCILYRLTCHLQILRMDDFAKVFERESDVGQILIKYLKIRRHLRIISHRFRNFVLFTLIIVTTSQFISLLVITKPSSTINLSTSGEIALCSINMVTGLLICLLSAAKITHKAQSVTSLATKWHSCSTYSSFENSSVEAINSVNTNWDSDTEEEDRENSLDNTKVVPIVRTVTYQKRQALVTYFVHNRAGITVYGFMLDRTLLHTIFAIQLSLTLWILDKTIGIS